jgi:hypothetical protein
VIDNRQDRSSNGDKCFLRILTSSRRPQQRLGASQKPTELEIPISSGGAGGMLATVLRAQR